ncbi:MAG: VOC family protein [Micrococcales bacterium]|nr:VOC family protein [Micrococcales bacterium]MCL2668838.1 VOC family protein [Micrococcales bacterium]
MSISVGMVTFDTTDARALAAWWAEQTGGTVVDEMEGFFVMVTTPTGVDLGFQKVPDPTPGKNRLHLECGSADPGTEVERLVAAGATLVAFHDEIPDFTWTVLADPDGNQFCVAAPPEEPQSP